MRVDRFHNSWVAVGRALESCLNSLCITTTSTVRTKLSTENADQGGLELDSTARESYQPNKIEERDDEIEKYMDALQPVIDGRNQTISSSTATPALRKLQSQTTCSINSRLTSKPTTTSPSRSST